MNPLTWSVPLCIWFAVTLLCAHMASHDDFDAELCAVVVFSFTTVGCAFAAFMLHMLQ
jgi:hypothetical protein